MAISQNIRFAARVLRQGGVIAYPTEGVFGLGCLPDDVEAVARILDIKDRDAAMGLVMIVSDPSQLDGWTAMAARQRESRSGQLRRQARHVDRPGG